MTTQTSTIEVNGDLIKIFNSRQITYNTLEQIFNAAFGDHLTKAESYFGYSVDGVHLDQFLGGYDSWHRDFKGIELSVNTYDYKTIRRRVNLDKNNCLSIKKLNDKVAELAALKKQNDEIRNQKRAFDDERESNLKEAKFALGIEYPDQIVLYSRRTDRFNLTLSDLSLDDAVAIFKFAEDSFGRRRKEEENG